MNRPEPAKGLLLVVDDDEDFRASLTEALLLEGYQVAEATDGKRALEWLSQGERPTAVLLDLWMPTMDGWQFRLELEKRGYDDVAIFVMTAARTQDAEMLRVAEVLEKPFTMPKLLAALERHAAATSQLARP
jgi:CheY-like chemotaxis protein